MVDIFKDLHYVSMLYITVAYLRKPFIEYWCVSYGQTEWDTVGERVGREWETDRQTDRQTMRDTHRGRERERKEGEKKWGWC